MRYSEEPKVEGQGGEGKTMYSWSWEGRDEENCLRDKTPPHPIILAPSVTARTLEIGKLHVLGGMGCLTSSANVC